MPTQQNQTADTSFEQSAALWRNQIEASGGALKTTDVEELEWTALMAARIATMPPTLMHPHEQLQVIDAAKIAYGRMQQIIADEKKMYFAAHDPQRAFGTERESPLYRQRVMAAAAQISIDERLWNSFAIASDLEKTNKLKYYSQISFANADNQNSLVAGTVAGYLLGVRKRCPAATESRVANRDEQGYEENSELIAAVRAREKEGKQRGINQAERLAMREAAAHQRQVEHEKMTKRLQEYAKRQAEKERRIRLARPSPDTTQASGAALKLCKIVGAGLGTLSTVTLLS